MASVAELDRLQGLVTRLTPLTDVQTGELIKADDWNTVVGAVVEVARAVVDEAREAVPPHEHADQVSVGWLDSRLRQLVEQGPLGDPAAIARLGALEGRVDRLQGSVEGLRDDVAKLRDLLTDVSTRDLQREAAVNTLHRTVGGIADARSDVLDVRATMRSIRTEVQTAVTAAASLKVDGKIVDVGELVTRVDRADELRDRLTLPTGELLDTAELQRQLATLQNSLVTHEELEDALAGHRPELSADEKSSLVDSLHTDLLGDLEAAGKELAASVDTKVGERLAGVDAQVARAMSDAAPGISEGVLGTVRPEIAAAAAGAVEQAGVLTAKAIDAATTTLRGDLTGEIADIRDNVAGTVADEIGRQLPGQLADVSGRIDGLEGRIAPVEEQLSAQEAASSKLGTRLDSLAVEEAGARDSLQKTLLGTLDERFASLDSRFEDIAAKDMEAAKGLVSDLGDELSGKLAETVKAVEGDIAGQVDGALRERLGPVESQVAAQEKALDSFDRRLTPLESTVATQEKTLAGIIDRLPPPDRLTTFDEALAGLDARIDPLETTVAGQEKTLTTLDDRVTTLADTSVTKDVLATQLAQTSAAIHADMTKVAQSEVSALRSDVPNIVKTQLAAAPNTRLITNIANTAVDKRLGP